MKNTVSRIEILKCMARDLEAGADRRNIYRMQFYRSIIYLIATDCDEHLGTGGGYYAFLEDIRCARNNSKLFDLVYLLMDPCESPEYLINILYFACYDDYYETVKYLIKQGIDVNYTSETSQDYNPKYLFTEVYNFGYVDIAYLLLDAGIKINPHDYTGENSKHTHERCEVIDYLIQKISNIKKGPIKY